MPKADPKKPMSPPTPSFGRGMQDVWALLPYQTVLMPPGAATGASASCYIWPPKVTPPADEMAHVVELARSAARRKALLFILCSAPEPLAAIKAAVVEVGLVQAGAETLQ